MAHHKSALKRIRQTERRTAVNRPRLGSMRSAVKNVEAALAGHDKAAAQAAFKIAEPELKRGAQAGVIDKNTAARKTSRLAKRIQAL